MMKMFDLYIGDDYCVTKKKEDENIMYVMGRIKV